LVSYLRRRTYTLANREEQHPLDEQNSLENAIDNQLQPIVDPRDTRLFLDDIDGLPGDRELSSFKELSVYYARSDEIPNVMHELGRLREITFRDVGEGTGTSIDLDEYDDQYVHLFLWNHDKQELVGAYRFGQTDHLMNRYGIEGLYTSTLFQYKQELLEQINPALEMGRAFVRSEYQNSYRPLLLLWKGIGAFVVENPRYRYLFGPVSINNEYQSMSHQLMVQFLQIHNFEPELADLVEPRTPFRIRPIKAWDTKALSSVVDDVGEVSSIIDDIETQQRGIPVLLRQYLKLGGKLLGFYVDPEFSNVVGGLILVDLLKTDRSILNRYMGREEAESFLMHHNAVVQ
jgi:putative hemolysin